jgi:hypothetical protein
MSSGVGTDVAVTTTGVGSAKEIGFLLEREVGRVLSANAIQTPGEARRAR